MARKLEELALVAELQGGADKEVKKPKFTLNKLILIQGVPKKRNMFDIL